MSPHLLYQGLGLKHSFNSSFPGQLGHESLNPVSYAKTFMIQFRSWFSTRSTSEAIIQPGDCTNLESQTRQVYAWTNFLFNPPHKESSLLPAQSSKPDLRKSGHSLSAVIDDRQRSVAREEARIHPSWYNYHKIILTYKISGAQSAPSEATPAFDPPFSHLRIAVPTEQKSWTIQGSHGRAFSLARQYTVTSHHLCLRAIGHFSPKGLVVVCTDYENIYSMDVIFIALERVNYIPESSCRPHSVLELSLRDGYFCLNECSSDTLQSYFCVSLSPASC